MLGIGFWSMLSVAALGMAVAATDTNTFITAANGVARAGLFTADKGHSNSSSLVAVNAVIHPSNTDNVNTLSKTSSSALVNHSLPADTEGALVSRYEQLSEAVDKVWLTDSVMPNQTKVVKYSADLKSRAIIDVKDGKLIVEVISDDPKDERLQKMLVQALLTPDDPKKVDLLSTEPEVITGKPFLLGQLVDSLGKPIDSYERAEKFAKWAMHNRQQQESTRHGNVQRVELSLDANHKQVRAAKFANLIEQAASTYQVDENLLYAITETESHFNPFAMSPTGAVGLMQLVPSKAGRDAVKALTGKDTVPSVSQLKDPTQNIALGAAYVARLSSHYLKDIQSPQNKELAVIAAYNGGASRALRVFAQEKSQAIAKINQLPPQIVYDALRQQHSSAETRGYVQKVTSAKRRYSQRV